MKFHWFTENLGNFHKKNRIYRLWKCGCHVSKLPVSKQLHGNGLPLATNSAIIYLTIIDLHRKEIQHGDCASTCCHTSPVITRAWFLPSTARGQEKQNLAQKRSCCVTFGEKRNQPPSPIAISSPKVPDLRNCVQYKYICNGKGLFS